MGFTENCTKNKISLNSRLRDRRSQFFTQLELELISGPANHLEKKEIEAPMCNWCVWVVDLSRYDILNVGAV